MQTFEKRGANFRNFTKRGANLKGKGSETVKPNQNESVSKTKLFGANFMQIRL